MFVYECLCVSACMRVFVYDRLYVIVCTECFCVSACIRSWHVIACMLVFAWMHLAIYIEHSFDLAVMAGC